MTLNRLPIQVNPKVPHAIETHSVISIDRVFFGTVDSSVQDVVLVQQGGKLGTVEVVAPDDPVVKPGERYVFFLAPDDRTELVEATDSPRYYAVGMWAGKVKVEKEKVKFLPRTDNRLKAHDDTDLAAFIKSVDDIINNRPAVMPNTQTAIPFPGPGKITAGKGR